MLKNFHVVTTANTQTTICTAGTGKEIGITSVLIHGGTVGGEITLTIAEFPQIHTVRASETIYLDSKISLPEGASVTAICDTDGVHISVSAIEKDV